MVFGPKGRSSHTTSVFLKGPTYVVPNASTKVTAKRSSEAKPNQRNSSSTRPKSAPAGVHSRTRDSSVFSHISRKPQPHPSLPPPPQPPPPPPPPPKPTPRTFQRSCVKDRSSSSATTITPISSRTGVLLSGGGGRSVSNTTAATAVALAAAGTTTSTASTSSSKRSYLWQEAVLNPGSSAFLHPPAPHLKYMKNMWVIEHPQEEDFSVRIPIKNETDTILESWSTSLPHIPIEKNIYLEANLKQLKDLDLAIKAQTSLSHCPLRTPFPMRVPKFVPRKKTTSSDSSRAPSPTNPNSRTTTTVTTPTPTPIAPAPAHAPPPAAPIVNVASAFATTTTPSSQNETEGAAPPKRSCLKSPDGFRAHSGDTRSVAKVRFTVDEKYDDEDEDNGEKEVKMKRTACTRRPSIGESMSVSGVSSAHSRTYTGRARRFQLNASDVSGIQLSGSVRSTISRTSSLSGRGKDLKKGNTSMDVTRKGGDDVHKHDEKDDDEDGGTLQHESNTMGSSGSDSTKTPLSAVRGRRKVTCATRVSLTRTEVTSSFADDASERIRVTTMLGSRRSPYRGRHTKSDNSMLTQSQPLPLKVTKEKKRRRRRKGGGRRTRLKRVEQKLDLQTSSQGTVTSKRSKGMQTNEEDFIDSADIDRGDSSTLGMVAMTCLRMEQEKEANAKEVGGKRFKSTASALFQRDSSLEMFRNQDEKEKTRQPKARKSVAKKSQKRLMPNQNAGKSLGKDTKRGGIESVMSAKKEPVREIKRRFTPSTQSLYRGPPTKQVKKQASTQSLQKGPTTKQVKKQTSKEMSNKTPKKESFSKTTVKKNKTQNKRNTTKSIKAKPQQPETTNSSSNSDSKLTDLFQSLLKYTTEKTKKAGVKNKQTRGGRKRITPKKDLSLGALQVFKQENKLKNSRTLGDCSIKNAVAGKKSVVNRVTRKQSLTGTTCVKTNTRAQTNKRPTTETKTNSLPRTTNLATESKSIRSTKRSVAKPKPPVPPAPVTVKRSHVNENKSLASQPPKRKTPEPPKTPIVIQRKNPPKLPPVQKNNPERKINPPTKLAPHLANKPKGAAVPTHNFLVRKPNQRSNTKIGVGASTKRQASKTDARGATKPEPERKGGTTDRSLQGKTVCEVSSIFDSLTCESLMLKKKGRDSSFRANDSLDSDFLDPLSLYEGKSDTEVGIPEISSMYGDNTEASSNADSGMNKTIVAARRLSEIDSRQSTKKTKSPAPKNREAIESKRSSRNTSSQSKAANDVRVIYSKKKTSTTKSDPQRKVFCLSSSPNSTDISTRIEPISRHEGSMAAGAGAGKRIVLHPLYDATTGQFRPPGNTAHRAEERAFLKKVNVLKQMQKKREMERESARERSRMMGSGLTKKKEAATHRPKPAIVRASSTS